VPAYGVLGLDAVLAVMRCCASGVARIIEPTSKIDAERVLTETRRRRLVNRTSNGVCR